jgi:hypothetical protein
MFPEVIDNDHLSTLVANIGDVGFNCFQSALFGLLNLHSSNPSRLVGKAICSIVKRNPDRLLERVLEQSPSLSLLSSLPDDPI